MQTNEQLDLAFNFLQHSGTNLFLTGKAGTGKTTFLRKLKETSPKRMIVVAPTGVAAINAGGVTIHSFFQLPFGPYLPERGNLADSRQTGFSHKFSREKINIIRSMDLLVIDEISMVRADLLDAISDVLRRFKDRNKPFGGVQLLLIGDLQQLAPVAKEEEWNLLKAHYSSAFFFDSHALSESPYLCIELTQVYRQADPAFVNLLNNIRDNCFDATTLETLNRRYRPGFRPDDREGYITLTTHNYLAAQINNRRLAELPGRSYTFTAEIKEDFPAYSYPTDERLELKQGAQVMFIKNDSSGEKRYYNGKIGKVVFLHPEKIIVADREGNEITVERETWDNVKYTLNAETNEISESIAGVFSQYPLKTAWAITIHKSQGLTFERAMIDASSAFSHGQVYVALSRCKSLEGLVLSSPITREAMIKDERIADYTASLAEKRPGEQQLREAEALYYRELVQELFDFSGIQQRLQYASYVVYTHLYKLYPELTNRYAFSRDNFRPDVTEVGERFQQQLARMLTGNPAYRQDEKIRERICKGVTYFREQLAKYCDSLPDATEIEIDNKEARKAVEKALDNLAGELSVKKAVLEASADGFDLLRYLAAKSKASIEPVAAPRKRARKGKGTGGSDPHARETSADTGNTPLSAADVRHPELYAMIKKWRYEKALEKELPAYTILQQKALIGISNSLPADRKALLAIPGIGKKILEMYGTELIELIDRYKKAQGGQAR